MNERVPDICSVCGSDKVVVDYEYDPNFGYCETCGSEFDLAKCQPPELTPETKKGV